MNSSDVQRLKERFILLSTPLSPEPTEMSPQLKKLEGIRFVIFDFYGTLFISGVGDIGVDEESQDIESLLHALAACGIPAGPVAAKEGYRSYSHAVEAHREKLIQEGYEMPEPAIEEVWLDVLNALKHKGLIAVQTGHQLARNLSVEFEARMNPVWPEPSLHRTLDEMREKGLEMGIISNSQFYTPIAFEALAGRPLEQMGFRAGLLHWSFEEKLKKPSLEFYRRFLGKLEKQFPGALPSSVLYVGNDMLKDIYPAATLGMKTALFAGDRRSLKWRRDDERCRGVEPDLVITSLVQLADCI